MSEHVFTVLGAGRQGLAAAHDLAVHGGATRVILADRDEEVATRAAARLDELAGRAVGEPRVLDATRPEALADVLRPAAASLCALPYALIPRAARAAIAAGTSMADLGGNMAVTREVLALDDEARDAGVTLVPDCGVAPGLAATLTAHAVLRMEEPRAVRIRCGGLPQAPRGPLDYELFFSVTGLLNEYLGEGEVLRAGERRSVPTLTELEELDLPAPFGRCEAFVTSGGTSTLPETFSGLLRDLDYKTVRYPGHCERIRAMRDLGLWAEDPVDVPGGRVRPRDVFEAVAERTLVGDGRDQLVLRVEIEGRHAGRAALRRHDVLDVFDEATGLSAMQRMTGYPAAMVVEALARGEARAGALPVEKALPPAPLVEGLAERGIRVQETEA